MESVRIGDGGGAGAALQARLAGETLLSAVGKDVRVDRWQTPQGGERASGNIIEFLVSGLAGACLPGCCSPRRRTRQSSPQSPAMKYEGGC